MLLALDTATAAASVAIYDRSRRTLLVETTWQARRRHTQDLMAEVRRSLQMANLNASDLSALAVTTGPGSFTGVRIAVSAVKGLGLGLPHVPDVVGVPTLSVTAAPWIPLAGATTPTATVCAYIQAGRSRYNWAWFGPEDLRTRPGRQQHHAGTAQEFAAALIERSGGPVWLAGESDSNLCRAVAGIEQVVTIDPVSSARRAGQLARVAALHLADSAGDDLATLQPLYLRNP